MKKLIALLALVSTLLFMSVFSFVFNALEFNKNLLYWLIEVGSWATIMGCVVVLVIKPIQNFFHEVSMDRLKRKNERTEENARHNKVMSRLIFDEDNENVSRETFTKEEEE